MISNCHRYIVIALSILLAVLIIITSCLGIFVPGVYGRETPNWQAQSFGQDIIDLFLVAPVLILSSLFAYYKNKDALLLRPGVLLYIIYTFTIFCFGVHFNQLFIVYCFILGLAVYLFLWFILSHHHEPVTKWFDEMLPTRVIGIYLIVIAAFFYLLWLSQIIPAMIHKSIPQDLVEAGLLTNPVQALDLAVGLPGFILTGVLLLRKHPLSLLMTPAVLFFSVLMDITIGWLVVVMKLRGLEGSWMIPIVMSVLALFSGVLLIIYLRSLKLNACIS
jgi:hypothetical protein